MSSTSAPGAAASNYIIKFKKGVSDAGVEAFYEKVAAQGGEVTKKDHKSSILPRATASLPTSFAQDLTSFTAEGGHEIIEYIEPDGEMKIQPVP